MNGPSARTFAAFAFATLHLKLKAAYPFRSRLAPAKASGLTAEQLALIPLWENASVFDEEQRLVIEYTNAVVACDVPDVLFARVVERYGEKGAVELTSLIGFWSCWAMLLVQFVHSRTPSLNSHDAFHLKPMPG